MKERISKNLKRNPDYGLVLRKAGGFAAGLALVTLEVLRELFVSIESQDGEQRRLHDSDHSGEHNHRTGRLDAGTDPYGWYDD
jgi:hypothetical protein